MPATLSMIGLIVLQATNPPAACERPEVRTAWRNLGEGDSSAPVYIEPTAFDVSHRGEVLLAGEPTYIWSDARPGNTEPARNAIAGVLLNADGDIVRHIPASRLSSEPSFALRAAQLDSSTWLFVGPVTNAGERRLYSAEWTDDGWTFEEPLPSTAPGRPLPEFATDLVSTPGGVALAMPVEFPDGLRVLALYRRTAKRWTVDLFRPRFTGMPSLSYRPSEGLVLAVTGRLLFGRSPSTGYLLVYTERNGWNRPWRVVKLPSADHLHDLKWSSSGNASGLMWTEVSESTAALDAWFIRDVFADSASALGAVQYLGGDVEYIAGGGEWRGRVLWAVTQIHADGTRRLKVFDATEDPAVVLYDGANVFDGPVNAVWKTADELWVTGGALATSNNVELVESRLLRFTFACPGG